MDFIKKKELMTKNKIFKKTFRLKSPEISQSQIKHNKYKRAFLILYTSTYM